MSNEEYVEIEEKKEVVYIGARTKPFFKEMLNSLGEKLNVGKITFKYGDALEQLDEENFITLFNKWVTKCCEEKIMVKTLSTESHRHLEWRQDLSEVERAYKSMLVLKEML